MLFRSDFDYTWAWGVALLDRGREGVGEGSGHRCFGAGGVVGHERLSLLKRPLIQRLLDVKWRSFGRFLFYLNFFTYLTFLIMLSAFIVSERQQLKLGRSSKDQNSTFKFTAATLFNKTSSLSLFVPYIIFLFMMLHLLKELIQMCSQRGRYFTEFTNYLELIMYMTCSFFILYYILPEFIINQWLSDLKNPSYLWVIGAVSVFLGYIILILFFRR